MNELVKIALMLLQSGGARAAPAPRRLLQSMLINVLVAGSLVGASMLLVVALWLYLLPLLGAALTPLVLAVGLIVLALAGLVAKRWTTAKPIAEIAAPPPIAIALDDAARIFNANKLSVLGAALMAGIALAYSEKASRKRHP